jgi:hypothetical protein
MLFQPPTPPPNPHHPFVYRDGEIRLTGDLGDRYEADVWESRSAGWAWSARYTDPDMGDGLQTGEDALGGLGLASEHDAVTAAVAWLRARCVAVHGRCG